LAAKGTLNDSVNLLADVMRKVFSEAVEGAGETLTTEVKALRTDVSDMEGRLDKRMDSTNENMQTQFAHLEKKIGQIFRAAQDSK